MQEERERRERDDAQRIDSAGGPHPLKHARRLSIQSALKSGGPRGPPSSSPKRVR